MNFQAIISTAQDIYRANPNAGTVAAASAACRQSGQRLDIVFGGDRETLVLTGSGAGDAAVVAGAERRAAWLASYQRAQATVALETRVTPETQPAKSLRNAACPAVIYWVEYRGENSDWLRWHGQASDADAERLAAELLGRSPSQIGDIR